MRRCTLTKETLLKHALTGTNKRPEGTSNTINWVPSARLVAWVYYPAMTQWGELERASRRPLGGWRGCSVPHGALVKALRADRFESEPPNAQMAAHLLRTLKSDFI